MEASSIYNIVAIGGIDWVEFFIRTLLNTSALFIIIHTLKTRQSYKNDFLSILIIINLLVFLIGYFVAIPQISAGFAFGAFVVFITQRYNHTEANPDEIIYISVGIFTAYLNGANSSNLNLFHAAIVDIFILSFIYFLENIKNNNNSSNQGVVQ